MERSGPCLGSERGEAPCVTLLGLPDLSEQGFPGSLTQAQNKTQPRGEIPAPPMSPGSGCAEPGSHFAARRELLCISLFSNAAKPFFSPYYNKTQLWC